MTDAEKLTILERHVRELSEIYDCVQVLATGLRPDNTTFSHKRGSGNFYARQGLAHEFIQDNVSEDLAVYIAKELDPPDDWKA